MSINDVQAEELKPEQQKILDEIAADEAKLAPKVEEVKETPKVEAEPVMQEEVKPEEKEEEPTEFADEDEEQEDVKDVRQPKFVRLEKHLKLRDKVKDLEAKLAGASSQVVKENLTPAEQTAITDEVAAFAEANGYDAEQTKKLVMLAEEGAYKKLEEKFAGKFAQLETVAKQAQQEKDEVEQENIFSNQFKELGSELPQYKEHIQELEPVIKKLAFSKEFHLAPLSAIYTYLREVKGMKPTEKRATVEGSNGGTAHNDVSVDFERIARDGDEQAIKSMDSKTFAEFKAFIKTNRL